MGLAHMEVAEDIVADTFLKATEIWGLKGLPDNPVGWLYTVAKNKARDVIRREALFNGKLETELARGHSGGYELDLSEKNLLDSQLQMMFAICQPEIPAEAQIGLALRILCGFGIDEIASAFLTNKETINKRLFRAKEKLREAKVQIAFPAESEVKTRLQSVLRTLYLLFNEGYFSSCTNALIRKDLCLEAMRLAYLLTAYPPACVPSLYALLALMCFQSSRFGARVSSSGDYVLYEDQDSALWDASLIQQGEYFMSRAASGDQLSKYHLEAGIAYWHTRKQDSAEKWKQILQLYNHLLVLEYSPIAALNRTYAVMKVHGVEKAIAEAECLGLEGNYLYHSILGELYSITDQERAIVNWKKALLLCKSEVEKKVLQRKTGHW